MTQRELSFEELANGLKASDHGAYKVLFDRMYEPLLRYVYRFTQDESLCLDVVQDVFMKLWEKRQKLIVHTSLKALLYTMCRNQALNAIRGKDRTVGMSEITQTEPINPGAGIEHDISTRQLDAFFKAWVKELPPRRAEAFVLSRYHGFSHAEISDIMGLSKRTIDTHIVHALRFLRSRFDFLQKQGAGS